MPTKAAQILANPSLRFNFAQAVLLCLLLVMLGSGCASIPSSRMPASLGPANVPAVVGIASYYGRQYHGKKTASGEIYNMQALTGAHRTLPFGTSVKVTNLANDRSVVLRINDRGPFVRDRIVDVSFEAARRLGMLANGTARIQLEIWTPPQASRLSGTERQAAGALNELAESQAASANVERSGLR